MVIKQKDRVHALAWSSAGEQIVRAGKKKTIWTGRVEVNR